MVFFSAWNRRGGKFFLRCCVVLLCFFPLSAAIALPALEESRGKDQGRFEAAFFPKKPYVHLQTFLKMPWLWHS